MKCPECDLYLPSAAAAYRHLVYEHAYERADAYEEVGYMLSRGSQAELPTHNSDLAAERDRTDGHRHFNLIDKFRLRFIEQGTQKTFGSLNLQDSDLAANIEIRGDWLEERGDDLADTCRRMAEKIRKRTDRAS